MTAKNLQRELSVRIHRTVQQYAGNKLTRQAAINHARKALSETRVQVNRLASEKVAAVLGREMAPSKTTVDDLNNATAKRMQDFTQILIDHDSKPEATQNRVDLLVHDAVWRDYNQATTDTMASFVGILPVDEIPDYTFEWTTHPEETEKGPCADCDDMNGTEFTAEEVEGVEINEHPNCVCTWELVIY